MTQVANRTLDITLLVNTNVTVEVEIPEELEILEGMDQPCLGYSTFRILHQKFGDKRITWRGNVLQEINAAKKLFVELIKSGLTPYRVGTAGKPSSSVMQEFDPTAEEVVFLPKQMVAGG